MGVDVAVLDFLFQHRSLIKGQTLQLGRQSMHTPRELAEPLLQRYAPGSRYEELTAPNGYTEKLFQYLGASFVQSMDASGFEKSEFVHDLNAPIPRTLHERFDTVFDGGTIEHIFDIPAVFENVDRLLKIGGLFISVNGANNHVGHGFYQFSPELFWRSFSREAGYEIVSMQLVPLGLGVPTIVLEDPAVVGHRIEIGGTPGPVYLMMAAIKRENAGRRRTPQQSDYATMWRESAE